MSVFFFSIFLILFASLVYNSFLKYKKMDTVISRKFEDRSEEKIAFPSFSVCPGFKDIGDNQFVEDYTSEWTPSIFTEADENGQVVGWL